MPHNIKMATGAWPWLPDMVGSGGGGGQGRDAASEKNNCMLLDAFTDYSCGLFWQQSAAVTTPDDDDAATETRMPETSSPGANPCSPGTRQDDGGAWIPPSPSGASTRAGPEQLSVRSPPKVRRNSMKASEAYNKGMLFQYIIQRGSDLSDCRTWSTAADDYESNWDGHLPLDPYEPECDGECDPDGIGSAASSATERRLARRRLRRGVMAPPRRNPSSRTGLRPQSSSSLPDGSIAFPEDVMDPQLTKKKEWKPAL